MASPADEGEEGHEEDRDEEEVHEDDAEEGIGGAAGVEEVGPVNVPDRVASGSKVPVRICASTASRPRSGPAMESREYASRDLSPR